MDSIKDTDKAKFEIGEDLYGVSVLQLKARLAVLATETQRIEAEIVKKERDLSAAHNIFKS